MFAWARELVLLGVLWVIYSIYHREDTSSKGGNQPNGKTKTSKVPPVTVPPVEFEKMNHYEVLGVSDDATAEDLKKAYRKKILEHHPDKNLDDMDGANKRFAKVKEAYELRANYDFIRANPPDSTGLSCPGAESYSGPSRQAPPAPDGMFSWANSFFASTEGSSTRGGSLPESVNRLMPQRYLYQMLSPVGRRSISLENVIDFLEGISLIQQSRGLDFITFFTVFEGLFKCIAYDESLHGGRPRDEIPCFGGLCYRWNARDSVYCEEHRDGPFIEDFYKFWKKFKSVKDFSWLEFCGASYEDLYYPQVRRAVEKRNKLGRKIYRDNYVQVISDLAKGLMDTDPRYHRFIQVQHSRQSESSQPHRNNNDKKKKKKKKKKRGGRH